MGFRDADYATADEMAAYLGITDSVDDVQIALAITAASRAIDRACGRAFGVDSTATTRDYRDAVPLRFGFAFSGADPMKPHAITVDDISSTTGLVVQFANSDAWTPTYSTLTADTDYRLLPRNADSDGRPFEQIAINPTVFRCGVAQLQVTAKFGWAAVPDTIKQACLVQASRFLKRRDAPFGIAGSPEIGSELRLLARVDPDVAVMVNSYTRRWAAV